jgi:hypothetical protein
MGTLQWLVLRARVAGARWWVPASIVGWAAGGAAADAVGYFVDGLDIVAGPIVAAATSGLALVALLRSHLAVRAADPSLPSTVAQARPGAVRGLGEGA